MSLIKAIWILPILWVSSSHIIFSQTSQTLKKAPRHIPQHPQHQPYPETRFKSTCNTADEFAPCACRSILTGITVHKNGSMIHIEFPEFACFNKENRRRIHDKEIEARYTCFQIWQETTIVADADENPLKPIAVRRRNGCELRCISKECSNKIWWNNVGIRPS